MLKVDEVSLASFYCPCSLKGPRKYFCSHVVRFFQETYGFYQVLGMYGFITLKSYQGYKNSVESLPDILMAIVLSYFLA